jgi:hypothetical protein
MGNWDYKDEAHELGLQLDNQRMQYRKLEEVNDELQHDNEYLRDQLADRKPVMRPNSKTLLPMICQRMKGLTTWT